MEAKGEWTLVSASTAAGRLDCAQKRRSQLSATGTCQAYKFIAPLCSGPVRSGPPVNITVPASPEYKASFVLGAALAQAKTTRFTLQLYILYSELASGCRMTSEDIKN